MEKNKQNPTPQGQDNSNQLTEEAARVKDLTSRAGGLVTRELVRQGEEIAKEIIPSKNDVS